MNFIKSIEICFNKFANFEGRARKSEFWWFQLFCVIVQIVGMFLDALLGYTELFVWVGYIIVLLPSLVVGARRLYDTGRSGLVSKSFIFNFHWNNYFNCLVGIRR